MSSKDLSRYVEYSVFLLLALVTYVWGSELEWEFEGLTRLEVFPLLGMIAFVTMWWHFLVGFVKRLRPDYKRLERLHEISRYWVFVSFTLHPFLLTSWGMSNGYELPPFELYRDYAGKDNYPFVVLGMLSLTVFLLYDIAKWLGNIAFFKRHWPIIDALSDAAFVGIWIHSLSLGQHVEEGWFRVFWILLGLSGIGFIAYKRFHLTRREQSTQSA